MADVTLRHVWQALEAIEDTYGKEDYTYEETLRKVYATEDIDLVIRVARAIAEAHTDASSFEEALAKVVGA